MTPILPDNKGDIKEEVVRLQEEVDAEAWAASLSDEAIQNFMRFIDVAQSIVVDHLDQGWTVSEDRTELLPPEKKGASTDTLVILP